MVLGRVSYKSYRYPPSSCNRRHWHVQRHVYDHFSTVYCTHCIAVFCCLVILLWVTWEWIHFIWQSIHFWCDRKLDLRAFPTVSSIKTWSLLSERQRMHIFLHECVQKLLQNVTFWFHDKILTIVFISKLKFDMYTMFAIHYKIARLKNDTSTLKDLANEFPGSLQHCPFSE